MPKFLNRFESTEALKDIILQADKQLILVSPYIKLNDNLKNALLTHEQNPELALTIVYGKNENNKGKSLSDEDFDFFKRFSNVRIKFHKRLHAKMYANDLQCLTTSMNLHDYSLKNNIETGILTEFKFLDLANDLLTSLAPKLFSNSLDTDATDFVQYIVERSTIEFERKAKRETSIFGLFTSYSRGEVSVEKSRKGFCIRSKQVIPFNVMRPYDKASFDTWTSYGANKAYEEKYCHSCGSANRSSMYKPVCYSCYKSPG